MLQTFSFFLPFSTSHPLNRLRNSTSVLQLTCHCSIVVRSWSGVQQDARRVVFYCQFKVSTTIIFIAAILLLCCHKLFLCGWKVICNMPYLSEYKTNLYNTHIQFLRQILTPEWFLKWIREQTISLLHKLTDIYVKFYNVNEVPVLLNWSYFQTILLKNHNWFDLKDIQTVWHEWVCLRKKRESAK